MRNIDVPKATLHRYPIYLKALRRLQKNGVERVMSKELANLVDIEPTTIRRDFSFLGNLGKQGYGYDVDRLIEIFNAQLGVDFDEKIILVGAGNLGRALINYNKWDYVVGEIACAFDVDPDKCGEKFGVEVYPMEQLEQKIPDGAESRFDDFPRRPGNGGPAGGVRNQGNRRLYSSAFQSAKRCCHKSC